MGRKAAVALLLLAVTAAACGREGYGPAMVSATDGAIIHRSREIIRFLDKGDYETPRKWFRPELRDALPASALALGTQAYFRRKGPFTQVFGRTTVVRSGRYRIVDIVLSMAYSDGLLRVSFDPLDRVTGLFLLEFNEPLPGY